MLYRDNYFAVSVKLNFCWRQINYFDDQDKVRHVTDTAMNSVNVKHQGESSYQLALHLSTYKPL